MYDTLIPLLVLDKIRQGFDGAALYLEQDLLKGPSCIDGCGKCCMVNVPQMTTIEAIYAVSVLTGLGRLGETLSICEDWLLNRSSEAPSYEGMMAGRFVPSFIHAEHEALSRSRCPFLTKDLRCFIHEARPMACRAFGVTVAETKGICPRPLARGETMFSRHIVNCDNLQKDWRLLWKACKEAKAGWVVSGFAPAMILRAGNEPRFRALADSNQIATAKIIGGDLDTNLMWQYQADRLDAGESPDLVVSELKLQ
ncbi:MAG: YkgJ family cysteine cluster protein [Methylobacter sp.]|jgi:Fe-S-cluster containining protein|nr:YkgJ family cysteine cluster protein [Methylobacter sp.]